MKREDGRNGHVALGAYSFGIGDRFGMEGEALLRAVSMAAEYGVRVTPVWNKSRREHEIIGSTPCDVRREADAAVKTLGWQGSYFVDADHVRLEHVDWFVEASDFFTLDVADCIGAVPERDSLEAFVARYGRYAGEIKLPGVRQPVCVTAEAIRSAGRRFLAAAVRAAAIYRRIAEARDGTPFIVEVSMDECTRPQSPVDLLFILAALAEYGVPVRTIAPKFVGRFNKGVDYEGSVDEFRKQFEEMLSVIEFAVSEFGLPRDVKLSVHSGSDKFSIFPIMAECVRRHGAGLHVKTAGTTWLEEVAGLCHSGGEGLAMVVDIYCAAYERMEELREPYKTVTDIDRRRLPEPTTVRRWSARQFSAALLNDPANEAFLPCFRQLMHVAYRVAAEMGDAYLSALRKHSDCVGPLVTRNIFERHLKPLFITGVG